MAEITVSKWGNSLGIRIPNIFVRALNINDGDVLQADLGNDRFSCVKPTLVESTAKSIIEEFYGVPYAEAVIIASHQPADGEMDWGSDVGGEVIV